MLRPMKRRSKKSTEFKASRRVFVRRVALFGGGTLLFAGACKRGTTVDAGTVKPGPQTTSHQTFTNDEFAVVSAAVDRIIPADEEPGALAANVPEYIDRILQTPVLEKMKRDFVPGVAALDRRCKRLHQVGFAEATAAQKDEVLTIFKNSEEKTGEYRWFEMLITLTMEGFLGDPSYGGNKDKAGWKLVGFDLVGAADADPKALYNGAEKLQHLRCGGGKGC